MKEIRPDGLPGAGLQRRVQRRLRSGYRRVMLKLLAYSEPDVALTVQTWRRYGARIGSNVHVDPSCYLDQGFAPLLEIHDHAVVAMGTAFVLHDSSVNNAIGGPLKIGRIVVEAGAYIGAFAVILPGVVIGRGAIVGAGSLVASSVLPGTVSVGRPAKTVCSVQDLAQRFSERALVNSDMMAYPTFPSQTEKEKLSLDDIKTLGLQSTAWAESWLRSLRDGIPQSQGQ